MLSAFVAHPWTAAYSQTFTPLHPPSAPLVTRGPYVSTWQPNGIAPGTMSQFWQGAPKPITGIVAIDGKPFLFLGAPVGTDVPNTMAETALRITPTQSVFTFAGGGITLTVDFLSPVEPSDFMRQSIPLSDITMSAQSNDGSTHTVSIYMDIEGAWGSGSATDDIAWMPEEVSSGQTPLDAWSVGPAMPQVFSTKNSYPEWGRVLWATSADSTLSKQSGPAATVRGRFLATGALNNSNDTDQPRAISTRPVFAFARALGTVGAVESRPVTFLLGHVRDPAIEYFGQPIRSLWTKYFPDAETMLAFAFDDRATALKRAEALDNQITATAMTIGGAQYAALTALSLRQAFAATELINTPNEPSLLLEEISSNNDISSVDVIYPSMPVFLALKPRLLRALLAPLLFYGESGRFPEAYAVHDLGTYPRVTGHDDGNDESMPVEASASMLLMVDAYIQKAPLKEAQAYASAHYPILKQWTEFLLQTPTATVHGCPFSPPGGVLAPVLAPVGLDSQYELTTLDALGCIAHSVRLGVKGLLAVGAMSQIAAYAGNLDDSTRYGSLAQTEAATWAAGAQNNDSSHLLRSFREPTTALSPSTAAEPDSDYELKFDFFADRLLGLNLVPSAIKSEEAQFYRSLETPKGILLQPETIKDKGMITPFTTVFWELWAATGTGDTELQQDVINEIYTYANTLEASRPFPDRYNPNTSYNQWEARPVVGGLFAPFLTK